MRIDYIQALRFALLALAATPLLAHAATDTKDTAAIRAASAAFLAAYTDGKVDAVVDRFEANAVVMPPNLPTLRGRDDIRAFVTRGIANARANGIVLVLESGSDVEVNGDIGWHSGAFSVHKAGATIDSGRYLEAWHKHAGQWRMTRRIWNSDRPVAGR